MVNEVRIYMEGGGDTKQGKRELREGMATFLRELRQHARDRRVKWHLLACRGRHQAEEAFQNGIGQYPDAFCILLIGSEGPVSGPLSDQQRHLMVQMMEAWFMADKENVAKYFGQGFNVNVLPQNPNVEQIPKAELEPKLKAAAKGTKKQTYEKIRDGCALLMCIGPAKVRDAAPHCARLFTTLEGAISGGD